MGDEFWGIRSQLEVFEPRIVNFAKNYNRVSKIPGLSVFNILIGNPGWSPADLT